MKDDDCPYRVIANIEDAYAILPVTARTLSAWRDVGKIGTREDCLAYICQLEEETRAPVLRRLVEHEKRRP